MHDDDVLSGVTYQLLRPSDLKLLKTSFFDVGTDHSGQISPEEPRRGPDDSIQVQTLGSGIERITDVTGDQPKSQLIHTFPERWCGVPTIVGHYLIQSVPVIRSLIVLDIADPMKPVETSRLRSMTPIVRTGPDGTAERSAWS